MYINEGVFLQVAWIVANGKSVADLGKVVTVMVCTIRGCPGEYEEQKIIHSARYHGQIVVIDHVPTQKSIPSVETFYLRLNNARRIEKLLETAVYPASVVPLCEFT